MCSISPFWLWLTFGSVYILGWHTLLFIKIEDAIPSFSVNYGRAKLYYEFYRYSNRGIWGDPYKCLYLNQKDFEILRQYEEKYKKAFSLWFWGIGGLFLTIGGIIFLRCPYSPSASFTLPLHAEI